MHLAVTVKLPINDASLISYGSFRALYAAQLPGHSVGYELMVVEDLLRLL